MIVSKVTRRTANLFMGICSHDINFKVLLYCHYLFLYFSFLVTFSNASFLTFVMDAIAKGLSCIHVLKNVYSGLVGSIPITAMVN